VGRHPGHAAEARAPPALLYQVDTPAGRRAATPTGFRLRNTRPFPLLDLYLFPAPGDPRQQVAYVHELGPGEVLQVSFLQSSESEDPRVRWLEESVETHLDDRIRQTGLFPEEARLCVETVLDPAFLAFEGRKAAYRLPRREYDRLCPLTITPPPRDLIRVGLVLVTDLQHRTLEHYCHVAERGDSQDRRRAVPILASVGDVALEALGARIQRTRGKYRDRLQEARAGVAELLEARPSDEQ
jgi:hypothetical protein